MDFRTKYHTIHYVFMEKQIPVFKSIGEGEHKE